MLPAGRRRLLIVDDERNFLRILAENFVLDGYDVAAAENDQAALALARQAKPDIAVIDFKLPKPGMDGISLGAELRKEIASRMPIVLMTGDMTASLGAMAKGALGPTPIVPKPLDYDALAVSIRRSLEAPGCGRIALDEDNKEAWIDGTRTAVVGRLYDVFAAVYNAGAPLSTEKILLNVWPAGAAPSCVRETVCRLNAVIYPRFGIRVVSRKKALRLEFC